MGELAAWAALAPAAISRPMPAPPPSLPQRFADWFASRGWSLHPHQAEMLARRGEPALLLIAPTGGGKTLASFLPTLVELEDGRHEGLHTLYVSPLKALAADIRRNLTTPVGEMALPVRVEDRTGDTKQSVRRRQRADPPHILLTTPESLALMLSYEDAPRIFAGLTRVIVDEIHALTETKRGDQLMLALGTAPDAAAGAAPRGALGDGGGSRGDGRAARLPSRALRHRPRRPRPCRPTSPSSTRASRRPGRARAGATPSPRCSIRCAATAPR